MQLHVFQQEVSERLLLGKRDPAGIGHLALPQADCEIRMPGNQEMINQPEDEGGDRELQE